MTHRVMTACAVMAILVAGVVSAAEDVQWIRVTALLETGAGAVHRAEEALVPGGVYSLEEVDRRGLDAIDAEILERVRFLGEGMRSVEETMRLATLLARQYYLPLQVGKEAVLPTIDLNPRLGIVFSPLRFVGDRAVCKVQFLEPDGPSGTTDFSGDPITLRLQDADLRDVLKVFSKIAPYSIEVDPKVVGTVTVNLRDLPWDQALDLVLRINNLGWEKEGDTLRVAPLNEMSRRKRVRTDATINLPRGAWGSATIASRGDADNPTVVLMVESVEGPPDLVAERDGLAHPKRVMLVTPRNTDLEGSFGELAVFRGKVTEGGRLQDLEILAAPSQEYGDRLLEALNTWEFRSVLDEEGRRNEAVVGYGIRLLPSRVLASIGAVEHVGVDVSCRPVPNEPGQYVFSAIITDLDTGGVLSSPIVHTLKGSVATVRTGLIAPSGEPALLEISFLVADDGKGVSYSWTLTSEGTVLSSHKAEFEL